MMTIRPGLTPQMQFFGLLILLAPLFAGLQHLVGERASTVGVPGLSQSATVTAPPERIVERVVERIVYVTVPADEVREGQIRVTIPTEPGQLPIAGGAVRVGPAEASRGADTATGPATGVQPAN